MGAVYRGRWGGRGGGGMLLDYIHDARTDTVTAKQRTNKIENKTVCKRKLAKDKGDDTSIMESSRTTNQDKQNATKALTLTSRLVGRLNLFILSCTRLWERKGEDFSRSPLDKQASAAQMSDYAKDHPRQNCQNPDTTSGRWEDRSGFRIGTKLTGLWLFIFHSSMQKKQPQALKVQNEYWP